MNYLTYGKVDNDEAVVSDCTEALKNNSKYVKAMDRRARTLRKQAETLKKKESIDKVFRAMDVNGDGSLTKREMLAADEFTPEEIEAIFDLGEV